MENEKSNITKGGNTKIILSDNYLINTITNLLMKGKPVAISGFGYLETKELSGKKTVLYKTADSGNSVMKDFYYSNIDSEFISLLQEKLSNPLKNGKSILLEEVGSFNPVKSSDGSLRLSFIPALSLKNKLNKESSLKAQEKENKENSFEKESVLFAEKDIHEEERISIDEEQSNLKESVKEEKIILPSPTEKKEDTVKPLILVKTEKKDLENPRLPIGKITNSNDVTVQTKKTQEKTVFSSKPVEKESATKKTSSVGKVLFDAGDSKGKVENKKKKKVLKWTILSIVFFIVVIVCRNVYVESIEDKQENIETATENKEESKAIDLLSLSEKYYGDPAFWVYIYEANQEKLKSPINIPQNIMLIIPNLEEMNINPKDTTEIEQAKMKSDKILMNKKR